VLDSLFDCKDLAVPDRLLEVLCRFFGVVVMEKEFRACLDFGVCVDGYTEDGIAEQNLGVACETDYQYLAMS
jgi:hypothetical protein